MEQSPFIFDKLSKRDKRSLVFHLLYAMEACDYEASLPGVVENINRGFDIDIPLESEEVGVVHSIVNKRHELDEIYKPFLANWRLERLSVATKLILRYSTWELFFTPGEMTIIINEAIELAKCFAEKDAYKFINGVLDEVARIRPVIETSVPEAEPEISSTEAVKTELEDESDDVTENVVDDEDEEVWESSPAETLCRNAPKQVLHTISTPHVERKVYDDEYSTKMVDLDDDAHLHSLDEFGVLDEFDEFDEFDD